MLVVVHFYKFFPTTYEWVIVLTGSLLLTNKSKIRASGKDLEDVSSISSLTLAVEMDNCILGALDNDLSYMLE